LIGKSCPFANAQPLGAKPKDIILISDKKGSAIVINWLSNGEKYSKSNEIIKG
jgi:hypothetical protein